MHGLLKSRTTGRVGLLCAALLVTIGCGRMPVESELQDVAASTGPLNLRIGELATNGQAAWHVQIGASVSVDPASVKICFGPAASCSEAQWTSAPAVAGQSNIFAPAPALAMTHGALVTMSAVGADGQKIVRTVRIEDKTMLVGPGNNAVPQVLGQTSPQAQPSPLPQTSPTPVPSECWKADAFTCQVEVAIVRMTNEYRARSGLAAVVHAPKIGFVSRKWSVAQANAGSISHAGFPASRNRDYIAEFGSMGTARLSAENVAMFGGGSSLTAEAVARRFTDMWWNSPGHRAAMLGNYRGLGVGVHRRGSAWYGTQIFGTP